MENYLRKDARARMKQWRKEQGQPTIKDWMWLIPAILVIVCLLAHAVKHYV